MTEFKIDDDLKIDSSDRHSSARKVEKRVWPFPVSPQHTRVGLGVFVLLLLILGLVSVMNSGSSTRSLQGEREISLSMIEEDTQPPPSLTTDTVQPIQDTEVAVTPTEAVLVEQESEQRVELPGNKPSSGVAQQQPAVDPMVQQSIDSISLPTVSATLDSTGRKVATARSITASRREGATKQSIDESRRRTGTTTTSQLSSKKESSSNLVAGSFTLQLSAASRADTLEAFAKKHNLARAKVFETKRNGKLWYILVNGRYASSTEAKRDIVNLPAEVQAMKPWVKSMHQIQQELKQR